MIGLGSWGKNIYRNLETLNVLKKIYDSNTEYLSNTVTSKKKIANNADEIILSKDIDNITGLEFNNSQKNFQYGSGNNNDFYYFTGISLSYIFYKIPCPKNSAPYNSIY